MAIPGLGQIQTQEKTSTRRTISLKPLWEWRFEVPFARGGIAVRLISGTAERDGTELATNVTYRFSGTKSKLLTWHGAELDVEGDCDYYVAEHASPDETPMVSYLNLHFALQQRRAAAAAAIAAAAASARGRAFGPRVLVCGPPSCGRTSLVRSLAAWATRSAAQPVIVNADPREGMLSLPGTLSAAVFGSIMDIEAGSGGWGSAPSSGPSGVPVKLPIVHYYGRESVDPMADDDGAWPMYSALVEQLGYAVMERMGGDGAVGAAGCLVDAPAVYLAKGGMQVLELLVDMFMINVIVVLGSARMNTELVRQYSSETTTLGEPITVVSLEKSEGVIERDEDFLKMAREATIKEYFFGDAKRSLDPFTQQVDLDSLTIYKIPEASDYDVDGKRLSDLFIMESPDSTMDSWTLAVMNAAPNHDPDNIQHATVLGFVHVAAVDETRRKLKILAPLSGRLGDWPMIWGHWPEPNMNLLG